MLHPGLSAFASDIASDVATRGQSLSLSRVAADSAFLICPISLGMLAQWFSCSSALFVTAGLVGVANAIFALHTTEIYRRK